MSVNLFFENILCSYILNYTRKSRNINKHKYIRYILFFILLAKKFRKYELPARTPTPPSHSVMGSYSEDGDANDEGATTLCGLLAAMDLAPALKATSLMKLRSHSNQKYGP